MLRDLGQLALRMVIGPLLAGHGSQKLFGWFGGGGLTSTAASMESIGLRPSRRWAILAGSSEFSSGVLTTLGLFHPLGPIFIFAPMSMAIGKVHWGKPIWGTQGGAEQPVTNVAIGTSLILTGPGRFTMDRLLGIRLPGAVVALAAMATAVGIWIGLSTPPAPSPQVETKAGAGAEAGGETAGTVATR